jgi:hypothetical protein
MTVIPAGQLMMDDEQRTFDIRRFALSQNDITFAEWEACSSAGGCHTTPHPDDSHWGRGQRPVINVSWDDAKEYAAWLSLMTGQRYRLVSEAEWEYAARGNTSLGDRDSTYPWGDDPPVCDPHAPNGASFRTCPGQKTFPVGSFSANRFGLFDMAGNVLQWVEDCYQHDLSSAPPDGTAVEMNTCSVRAIRGGSWFDLPEALRSAARDAISPSVRVDDLGFRVARSLPASEPAVTRSAQPESSSSARQPTAAERSPSVGQQPVEAGQQSTTADFLRGLFECNEPFHPDVLARLINGTPLGDNEVRYVPPPGMTVFGYEPRLLIVTPHSHDAAVEAPYRAPVSMLGRVSVSLRRRPHTRFQWLEMMSALQP